MIVFDHMTLLRWKLTRIFIIVQTSADAITWTKPSVMFNTTGTLVAEPPIEIEGRKYSLATSFAAFKRTGPGAEHTGADQPLMRRVFSADKLGPVFWLGSVPAGMENFGYPGVLMMDAQTKADAAAYLRALVDAEPRSDWGQPNERAMYQLPADPRRLMLLLRAGNNGDAGAHMLAASCELDTGAVATAPPGLAEKQHLCRPITGLFNAGLPGDRMPPTVPAVTVQGDQATPPPGTAAKPWPGYHPVPVGQHCNWSAPTPTSIPDSHSRACTAPLPDGRIFMVGAQIPTGRDPLVLSLSKDGLDFSEAYAVRVCNESSCKPRFGGFPGFQVTRPNHRKVHSGIH